MALSTPLAGSHNDEIFASDDLANPLPKKHFPRHERDPRRIYQAVRDELLLDGNSRQNLATFCQTWIEPEVHRLLDDCIDKNMIDKDEYPQTAEIENRCVHMLANLWNSPDAVASIGCSTTGSSEAAMLGGMAMKWRWREQRRAAGKSVERPNLICGPVQICWHKFARYWDIELREIPMEQDRLLMSPAEVIARCDENTIGVVPTLGVTFDGRYEPVKAVSDALHQVQKESGLTIPIHVDGASGGFLAPFCAPDLVWDFRLPRVKSINTSGHKYGLAPLGCGWGGWREKNDLPADLVFNVNYLGGIRGPEWWKFSRAENSARAAAGGNFNVPPRSHPHPRGGCSLQREERHHGLSMAWSRKIFYGRQIMEGVREPLPAARLTSQIFFKVDGRNWQLKAINYQLSTINWLMSRRDMRLRITPVARPGAAADGAHPHVIHRARSQPRQYDAPGLRMNARVLPCSIGTAVGLHVIRTRIVNGRHAHEQLRCCGVLNTGDGRFVQRALRAIGAVGKVARG